MAKLTITSNYSLPMLTMPQCKLTITSNYSLPMLITSNDHMAKLTITSNYIPPAWSQGV